MKNGNLLTFRSFAMNAICCYCFLILMNVGIILSQPRDQQSYKQDVDKPLISKSNDSGIWTSIASCPEHFFACPERGPCIPPNWTCDGENDCDAGEDEDENFCSEARNKGSGQAEEAVRPARSPKETNHSENSSHLNSTREHHLNGSRDAQSIPEKSSPNEKPMEDQVFKSNKEFAKNLIRETSKKLYSDQILNSEPQILGSEETKLGDSYHKSVSRVKTPTSIDGSIKGKNEDTPSEKCSCCGGKHSGVQLSGRNGELQTLADADFKHLTKVEALGNITKDLLFISEKLKVFELSHNKDCIDKDYLEQKKQNLISKLTCPYHFQFVISSCIYVQVYPPVTWQEASSLCQSHGGKLITIHSTSYYENLLMQMEHDKQRSYSFWIGATNTGGLWTWVDNNPFNSLSLWGFTLRKNSKNLKLSGNHPNQCAFLDGNLLSYVNGASCLEEKGFICKSTTQ